MILDYTNEYTSLGNEYTSLGNKLLGMDIWNA